MNKKEKELLVGAYGSARDCVKAILQMKVGDMESIEDDDATALAVDGIMMAVQNPKFEGLCEEILDGKKMRVVLDDGAYEPKRAHKTDAGLDIRCREGFTVPAKGAVVVDTGVHVELPEGTCGQLWSKSGLNSKHAITTTGLIDEGYTGQIKVVVYNHGDRSYTFEAGDAITQLVVVPCEYLTPVVVESFDKETDRGENGFGSTGR